ncbi:hypothetical protein NSA27_00225 [Clostridium tepidum]|nr:hypothetical protein [Clostridium tepidum]
MRKQGVYIELIKIILVRIKLITVNASLKVKVRLGILNKLRI